MAALLGIHRSRRPAIDLCQRMVLGRAALFFDLLGQSAASDVMHGLFIKKAPLSAESGAFLMDLFQLLLAAEAVADSQFAGEHDVRPIDDNLVAFRFELRVVYKSTSYAKADIKDQAFFRSDFVADAEAPT